MTSSPTLVTFINDRRRYLVENGWVQREKTVGHFTVFEHPRLGLRTEPSAVQKQLELDGYLAAKL